MNKLSSNQGRNPRRLTVGLLTLSILAVAVGGIGSMAATSSIAMGAPTSSSARLRRPDATKRADPPSVSQLMAHMTLSQKIGQMFMLSFDGTRVTPQLARLIHQWQPGGFTLYSDNFTSPGQLRTLTHALQGASNVPLLLSVDQEGGEVVRVTSGVDVLPSEAYFGSLNNPRRLHADAAKVARQLRGMGLNMNLAPVLDVVTNPNSPIGTRSFGSNAGEDARLGVAAIRGYQSGGMAATAKHVLGLGTTSINAETQLPTAHLTGAQLRQQLTPFRAAIHAGVDAMMVTHVVLPGLTPHGVPASLSYHVVTGLLRRQLGFRGVIMTDSLVMGAITSRFGMAGAAVRAIQAGNDIDLIATGGPVNSRIVFHAESAVMRAVQDKRIAMWRINASVARILDLKHTLRLLR